MTETTNALRETGKHRAQRGEWKGRVVSPSAKCSGASLFRHLEDELQLDRGSEPPESEHVQQEVDRAVVEEGCGDQAPPFPVGDAGDPVPTNL